MAAEWRTCTVDEIKADQASAVAIGPFGSRMKSERYTESGVPVIRGNNITDTRSFAGQLVFVSEETADELRSSNVFADDLVFPHRGAIGQVGIVPRGTTVRYMLSTSLMKLSCNRAVVDPLFVFYFFRSHLGRQALLEHASTVGTPGIGQPLASLRSIRVPVPPLREQRAIAHILGTLDDKIELNRRMNGTLESMARALFKSWFVDFDPVRAKAEGRDTGLPPHIADLFPDSFEDSELGGIPKGWAVRSLDEIADFLNGLAMQRFPPTAANRLPVVKIAQLRAGDANGADWGSADIDPAYIIEDGDILFSWSGSLECVLWAGGRGALNQHLFKVTSPRYPRWLCYLGIHRHLDEFRRIAAGKATTMGHIQRHHLSSAKLPVPPPELLQAMSVYVQPILESTWYRKVQSRTLAALRDALLPKLISGELRARPAARTRERMPL
jgi:type I restriction enzyme S subunit